VVPSCDEANRRNEDFSFTKGRYVATIQPMMRGSIWTAGGTDFLGKEKENPYARGVTETARRFRRDPGKDPPVYPHHRQLDWRIARRHHSLDLTFSDHTRRSGASVRVHGDIDDLFGDYADC
jgi:hypothetical protein